LDKNNKILHWDDKQYKYDRTVSLKRRLSWPIRKLPDFLIIGAEKAGTTSLYEYLNQTPRVVRSRFKEIDFFNAHYAKGIHWYRACFPSKIKYPSKKYLTGESSPGYMFHPLASKRVQKFIPNVKIIIILRNPIDRAYSHYKMSIAQGREKLSFENAIDAEEKRLEGERERLLEGNDNSVWNYWIYSYISRGIYVNQLKDWFSKFSKNQFLVLNYDDLASDPDSFLNNVLDFLNLPEFHLKNYKIFVKGNYEPIKESMREKLQKIFTPYNDELAKYLGNDFGWNK